MLRRFYIFVALMLVVTSLAMAAGLDNPTTPRQAMRAMTGDEMINVPSVQPNGRPNHSSLDLIGELYQAGTTWYDYQHNGAAGKMVQVDSFGFVHTVWMNGLNSVFNPRHVYYNVWDPSTEAFNFQPGGTQVNASTRAGYTGLCVYPDGFAFPDFHHIIQGADAFTCAFFVFLPTSGAFTTVEPVHQMEGGLGIQLIWPKMDYAIDGKLHMVSTESARSTDQVWQRMGYSRGVPVFSEGFGETIDWEVVSGVDDEIWIFDTTTTIAATIACSPVEDRVVIAYTYSRYDYNNLEGLFIEQANNNLYLLMSEDGGNNWAEPVNVTNWQDPDYNCASGDTLECNKDTLRLYTDTGILFDEYGNLHVVFTTITFFELGGNGLGPGTFAFRQQSGIWHWGEEYQEFTPVYNDYNFYYNLDTTAFLDEGAWQFNAQRPTLAWDDSTDYLYCSIWHYESDQWTEGLFRMGDAYVSVSCNRGRSWSEAVNVTDTDGGQDTPAPGSLSERDITLADKVTYDATGGYLHMSYVLDHDAGAVIQTPPEGVATLNEMYYQRIPVNEIPLTPLVDPYWPALHVDSTGFPGMIVPLDPEECLTSVGDDRPSLRPESFALYQNYPNPFNPSTKIAFDLVRDARVTLKVFNVMGQEVATLIDGKVMTAGAQNVAFDASSLASGVYLYRVTVDGVTASKKMVLMK